MRNILFLTILIFGFSSIGYSSICGIADNRLPSEDSRIGRMDLEVEGDKVSEIRNCTVTMISKTCGITAGHCLDFKIYSKKVSFNVPLSNKHGDKEFSDKYNTYLIKDKYTSYLNTDYNNSTNTKLSDWAVVKFKVNRKTKKYPGEVGGFYPINLNPIRFNRANPAKVSISGYGSLSRFDNDKSLNCTLRRSYGDLLQLGLKGSITQEVVLHNVDIMPGGSGAAIINQDDEVIGIHSKGGCNENSGSANRGTLFFQSPSFVSAIKSCLNSELL